MTRDEAARAMGVATPEVRTVEDTEYGVAVVMSSGARRLIVPGDGFYATDEHPANTHLRRFALPVPDGDLESEEEPDEDEGEGEEDASDPGEKDAPGDDVPGGSIPDVLAWVGEDPERARLALEVERAQPSPRKSLIEKLEKL